MSKDLLAQLVTTIGVRLFAQVKTYDASQPVTQAAEALVPAEAQSMHCGGGTWSVDCGVKASRLGGLEVRLRFELVSGTVENGAVGLRLEVNDWSRSHYFFMPGAAYNGNRFHVHGAYNSPLPDLGPDCEVRISTAVPCLAIGEGESVIQLLTSDLTTPALGFHSPKRGRGLLLLTDDRTTLGLTSLSITENADRSAAVIQLMCPGVREVRRYNGRPSEDRGVRWMPGMAVELRCVLHSFEAPGVQARFDRFFDVRSEITPPPRRREEIPFSSVWAMQERKTNEQNWVEKYGYYSVGMRECRSQDWQTAWVGGFNTIYPLLAEGDALTQYRAARTFDFAFDGGIAPSGFFRGSFHEGKWDEHRRVFLRYSADALYFMLREFILLKSQQGDRALPQPWLRACRGVAEAFCRLWERYGRFGHYAATRRDELCVGGTCAASTAIGGLALASAFFGEPRFLEVASKAGRYYHENFVLRGLTNGGPGDILQSPDSESCYGLLESFVTLYEVTADAAWLKPACDVAHQCATWVVNYDFTFPPDSTFGKMDMLTTGTVFANAQNKHSAPGLCTLSGVSLLKLFRATGDRRYLQLIEEIAHAIPQYVSRQDRPIIDRRPNQRWPVMPAGWINERVNMSDWEVRGEPDHEIGVGEIFGGSTWSEPAMMLTYADLPGIYAQKDTKLLCILDHLQAKWREDGRIEIHNPTHFDAVVKVMVETSHEATSRPIGPLPTRDLPRVSVPAGQTVLF